MVDLKWFANFFFLGLIATTVIAIISKLADSGLIPFTVPLILLVLLVGTSAIQSK
jgi:hypothetical protein